MSTKKRSGRVCSAKALLRAKGIDPDKQDYFDLNGSQTGDVVAVAKVVGYRKGRGVPKSTGRAFMDYLRRAKCR